MQRVTCCFGSGFRSSFGACERGRFETVPLPRVLAPKELLNPDPKQQSYKR